MIRARLKKRIDHCFAQGIELGYWTEAAAGLYAVEEPKHAGQGDYATNFAMVVAGKEKKKPREVAAQLVELLAAHTDLLARVEVAGPGFVNCFLQ